MKEQIHLYKERITAFWQGRSKGQRTFMIGAGAVLAAALVVMSVLGSSSGMVPLYKDITVQEAGQIKAELDTRGIPYELDQGGTSILVPDSEVEGLLVDLAAAGIPNSGTIDYSFFSSNLSWGMTDNEFDVIKLDAMQTELAGLMTGIQGIENAKVMINMPEEQVFASDTAANASASIVLDVQPGYQLEANQVETLYNLVSKSVPDLSKDNIVIMDQNFNYFDNNSEMAGQEDIYTYQQKVKADIEKDIKQRLQHTLGMMIGGQKVIATVTADIDFTKENRVEELVEPVNEETMEGLPVSIERIEETYEDGAVPEGGTAGTGDEDIPNYEAGETGNGDYEMKKETINNEFNRIRKNIEESPYKVRDLGIQVAVDNKKSVNDDGSVEYLSAAEEQNVQESIQSIVDSMIMTSINAEYEQESTDEKVSIVFQEFSGQMEIPTDGPSTGLPLWAYAVGGGMLLVIIVLIWRLMRGNKEKEEEFHVYPEETPPSEEYPEIPQMKEKEDESTQKRKQLEKMAAEKPEDFAKLLRSWIADD
ncbi:flagellar basal body M-ring protein FliF [Halobacillus litoralis]|uniref:Flagellar M-ring protein n=1 Tax=Halobacillus litoralis TaxID=45668 RepID=A0A845DQM6_9BACI|nr:MULTISPECIES: flagellar basal-body MS-ring/collar protein FliF [Halobacillus]MYL19189.1 flagellar basal body M-ring protein FliF [Halobacillus litoralis]MYL28335.1 flagellar basal body M-ring protein FliF [Halobacillus halophilus]